jgi:hypothetical protein
MPSYSHAFLVRRAHDLIPPPRQYDGVEIERGGERGGKWGERGKRRKKGEKRRGKKIKNRGGEKMMISPTQ